MTFGHFGNFRSLRSLWSLPVTFGYFGYRLVIVEQLFRRGITVIISSLQLSASGSVFEEVREMMPWATKIEICPAVCPITGRDAFYTHRKIDSIDEITVGGADIYEPRCWEYHGFMNNRKES